MIGHDKSKFDNLPNKWMAEKLPNASWFQEGPGLRKWQFKDYGIKVINITNLVNGVLELDKTSRHISIEEFNKNYKHFECQSGDIVVASSGNSYCKHAIVRECDLPLVMNTSVIRFKPLNNCNYEYLNQFLKSKIFKDQIDFMITGGAQPNFGPVHLNQVTIPLPPLPEQQKIAEILSTVDAKIDVIDQQINETQALKKGLMQRLLTKGIGHTEFKDSPLGEIPKSWEVVKLNKIGSLTGGNAFKATSFNTENIGLQVIRMSNIQPYGLELKKNPVYIKSITEKEKKFLLKKGDLLITLTGTIGKTDYGNLAYIQESDSMVLNQRVGRFEYNEKSIGKFLYYVFSSEYFRNKFFEQGNGGTGNQANVGKEGFESIQIISPPIKEQTKIAEILCSVDDKLEVLTEKKTHYQELKQGLMQKLLTGKIRVNTKDTITA